MAFTVTFPTNAALPEPEAIAAFIRQRGEPIDVLDGALQLRALGVQLHLEPDRIRAQLQVTSMFPITRVVDLIFALSIFVGADVRLTGVGEVGRGTFWMKLADEQDRARIADALMRAELMGRAEEVSKRLWQLVSAIRPGCDDRWDTQTGRIVELKEVGAPNGISLADAAWHTDDPVAGDVLSIPVEGHVHTLAWRWLSEAYPNFAESGHTLH